MTTEDAEDAEVKSCTSTVDGLQVVSSFVEG